MAAVVVPWVASFLLTGALLLAGAEPPPSTPACTDELLSFSPCLSYVSSPPNNLTDTASPNCCKAFSSAVLSGAAVCFCYVLLDPGILGFPLNTTRLLLLSSVCPPTPVNGTSVNLNFLCSASPALPPLNSAASLAITSPSNTVPPESGNLAEASGRMPPKSGQRSPSREAGSSGIAGTAFSFPMSDGPVSGSTETGQTWNSKSWLLAGILTILVTLLNTVYSAQYVAFCNSSVN